MKSIKIAWYSKHQPTPRQRLALIKRFGTVEILVDRRDFKSVVEVINRFKRVKADEMVLVAPLTMIRAMVARGIKPLWAKMELCAADDPLVEVVVKGRTFKFVEWQRIERVELVTSQV